MCVLNVSKLFLSRVLPLYIKLKVNVNVNVKAKVVLNVDHDLCLLTYDDDHFKGNLMGRTIVSERKMCAYYITD